MFFRSANTTSFFPTNIRVVHQGQQVIHRCRESTVREPLPDEPIDEYAAEQASIRNHRRAAAAGIAATVALGAAILLSSPDDEPPRECGMTVFAPAPESTLSPEPSASALLYLPCGLQYSPPGGP